MSIEKLQNRNKNFDKEEISITDYGKRVKHRLIDLDMTQQELMSEINKKTGLFVDSGYMTKILTGKRNPPKVLDAIEEILNEKEGTK